MSEGELKQRISEEIILHDELELSDITPILNEAKAEFPYLADCQLRIKEQYPTLTPEESYLRAFQLFKDEACAWRDKWFGAP